MKRKKIGLPVISSFIFAMLLFVSIAFSQGGAPLVSKWYWNDAKISDVFEHISRNSGTDFVLDPSVTGKITVSVNNKSWKDVVNIICNMKELVAVDEENYIFVIKESEYYRRIRTKEADKTQLENIAELKKVVIKLKHTTVDALKGPVKGLLTRRGKVIVVEHTNSLIIDDVESNIPSIKELITKLDVELKQISISAKIMEVSSSTQRDLGIQWSLLDGRINQLPGGTGIAPSGNLSNIAFGILTQQTFSATLDYLATDSKSNLVAQPQITTLDNKVAEIFMSTQVPFNKQDVGGNTTTEYIDIRTGLTVTPHIMGNGKIMMDIKPEKGSYTISAGNIIQSTQNAETSVVVNNGETIVIAGLSSNEQLESDAGVPVLKNIPILGYLFKTSSKRKEKKDLIIFVTPHILN